MTLIHFQAKDYTIPWANNEFKEEFGSIEGRKCYEVMHNRKTPCEQCPTFEAFETKQQVVSGWESAEGKTFMTIVEPLPNEIPLLVEYAVEYKDELALAK